MKDENKKAAITKAIIGLINEIGFANISMSKIAKATGLSAATLYVYYENKEDMFRKVYLDVKKQMIEECSKNICPQENVQEAVRKLCKNLLRYMKEYTDEFLFIEQACNSPMATDKMLIDILFDVSLVKLNSAIIDGNHCQWQGLRRHKCPIDTDFVYDIRQSSRA